MKFSGRVIFFLLITFFFSIFIYYGCNDSGTVANNATQGSLVVRITDGPFPISYVAEANVTINKIEIRKANENNGNPFIVVSEDTLSFNLITLRNGITQDLAKIDIPVGSYDLVRLYVADASIKLTDGQEFNLKIPSGSQTGIKIFIDPTVVVEGGLSSELLLDFDLSNSFVVQGNPGTPAGIKGFHFKPVIRAVNNSIAGRLVGTTVDSSSASLDDVHVWLEQADTLFADAYSDTDGTYAIIGLPAGSYPAFAAKDGYDTVSVGNIAIVAGNQTTQDFKLTSK